jgi:hypothetical protein
VVTTHLSPRAIEAATQRIYEDKGDRKGVNYIGWEFEPEEVKAQWREDVSVSVVAYLTALEAEGMVVVPRIPSMMMIEAGNWLHEHDDRDCWRKMLQAAQGGDDAGQ